MDRCSLADSLDPPTFATRLRCSKLFLQGFARSVREPSTRLTALADFSASAR
jgi:hypothetical protein